MLTQSIARITRFRSVRIQNRLYYPYYFFQYRLRGKRLFTKVHFRVGCTVDLISGKEALVDTPFDPRPETVPRKTVLEAAMTAEGARERAQSYVCAFVSMKMKLLGSVELLQERGFMYYHPFWLVSCKDPDKVSVWIIVDGVSGRLHPLPFEEKPCELFTASQEIGPMMDEDGSGDFRQPAK